MFPIYVTQDMRTIQWSVRLFHICNLTHKHSVLRNI